jgi:hypothetical protein
MLHAIFRIFRIETKLTCIRFKSRVSNSNDPIKPDVEVRSIRSSNKIESPESISSLNRIELNGIYPKSNRIDLKPCLRQIWWNEFLSRFDTDIQHIPGITNSTADALSRYPYVQVTESPGDINAISIIEFNDEILESVKAGYP